MSLRKHSCSLIFYKAGIYVHNYSTKKVKLLYSQADIIMTFELNVF